MRDPGGSLRGLGTLRDSEGPRRIAEARRRTVRERGGSLTVRGTERDGERRRRTVRHGEG